MGPRRVKVRICCMLHVMKKNDANEALKPRHPSEFFQQILTFAREKVVFHFCITMLVNGNFRFSIVKPLLIHLLNYFFHKTCMLAFLFQLFAHILLTLLITEFTDI